MAKTLGENGPRDLTFFRPGGWEDVVLFHVETTTCFESRRGAILHLNSVAKTLGENEPKDLTFFCEERGGVSF